MYWEYNVKSLYSKPDLAQDDLKKEDDLRPHCFLTKFLWLNSHCTKKFLEQTFLLTIIFGHILTQFFFTNMHALYCINIISGPKFFWTNILFGPSFYLTWFLNQISWDQHVYCPKIHFRPKLFCTKYFQTIFWTKFFWTKTFSGPNFLFTKIFFLTEIFS